MRILLLRFDAPLMSFGSTLVDGLGVVQEFPGLSLLTGLLANALGYDHSEYERLGALQARLSYAVMCERPGRKIQDFHTVDLGQDAMDPARNGWTTRGKVAERAGASGKGTHIRIRDYWAEAAFVLAVALKEASESPTLDDLRQALLEPSRPLFLGRKCCIPSGPIGLDVVESDDPIATLREVIAASLPPPKGFMRQPSVHQAWWSDGFMARSAERSVWISDSRDWEVQSHVGERLVHLNHVEINGALADGKD